MRVEEASLVPASRLESGTAHSCVVLWQAPERTGPFICRPESGPDGSWQSSGWLHGTEPWLYCQRPCSVSLGSPGNLEPGTHSQVPKWAIRLLIEMWGSHGSVGHSAQGQGHLEPPLLLLLWQAGHRTRQLTDGPSSKATLLWGEIRGCATHHLIQIEMETKQGRVLLNSLPLCTAPWNISQKRICVFNLQLQPSAREMWAPPTLLSCAAFMSADGNLLRSNRIW